MPEMFAKNCNVEKSNAKERSYSITRTSEKNLERLKFEESEYFQERIKIRHRIKKEWRIKRSPRFAQSRFKRAICYASSNVFCRICNKCITNSKIRKIGYGVNHSVFCNLIEDQKGKTPTLKNGSFSVPFKHSGYRVIYNIYFLFNNLCNLSFVAL